MLELKSFCFFPDSVSFRSCSAPIRRQPVRQKRLEQQRRKGKNRQKRQNNSLDFLKPLS